MPISSFLSYIQTEKRYSSHTITAYKKDLFQFKQFVESVEDSFVYEHIDSKLIRSWIISLMDMGQSPQTVNRKISSLKAFFKFLLREGVIQVNPMDKITSPKRKKTLPVFIDEKGMNNLFDVFSFEKDFVGVRDKLILKVFYFTGIRRAELINLKMTDCDLKESKIKVLGKRNKERIIPIPVHLTKEIELYSLNRENLLHENGQQSIFLFISDKGTKLYDKQVYNIITKYLSLVSTQKKKSPHVLRHTFATHMLNNGADLNAVKELLGHANLSATQIYTHNTFEKLKSIYKQAHPGA